ncbi:hypothetical protein FOA43_002784 [Brettanomyces nanus]|uniref:mitogen-activated protein kinase kinase kinase n=1 Tax=Eeniella nana TaxID=13502 RepID=A0A875RPT3_EENNA|nr:uncharacterized protein FOA43_002784 [Brettanomyces nanus]QPG75430.1 hypothetical protein FOA43_002784 [Brettanomyces nanus]
MNEADKIQLLDLLRSMECDQYYELFEKNDINIELLSSMDRPALKELGVTKVGDRLRVQILISLLNIEKIRSKVPMHELVEAIKVAYSALTGVDDDIGVKINNNREERRQRKHQKAGQQQQNDSQNNYSLHNEITVITQDGQDYRVDITDCYTSSAIKRNILQQTTTSGPLIADEWSTYYRDKSNSVHLMFNIELATVCNSPGREEKSRIIFCRTGEAPSQAAIEKSNEIIAKSETSSAEQNQRSSMIMRNMIGQRPPSQLISTNLGEYFPEVGPTELKKVMRNSYRLSMYGSRVLQQQARQSPVNGEISRRNSRMKRNSIYSNYSMISRPESVASGLTALSSGVGYAMRINQTVGDVLLSNSNAIEEEEEEEEEEKEEEGEEEEEEKKEEDVAKTLNLGNSTFKSARASVDDTGTIKKEDVRTSSFIKLLDEDEYEAEDLMDAYGDMSLSENAEDEPRTSSVMSILTSELNHGPSIWHKGSKIGQGSYGSVYLGLDGLTGELMAVKEVDLPTSSEDSKNKMVTALKREMELLRELHHENIVRYLGSASDSSKMYIFLEYIPGGSVSSMLHTYGPFEEPLIRNFLTQVLIGVRYLHNNGIIHRDIKGANILIDINGTVKIGDFGISKRITPSNKVDPVEEEQIKQSKRASFQGSVYWMAPEVVKQVASTEKSDIWSTGCLAIEMFTAKHPYPEFSQMQAIFRIGTLTLPKYPSGCSDSARDFLDLAFETDYRKRVSATNLLKHPFFKPLFNMREKQRK